MNIGEQNYSEMKRKAKDHNKYLHYTNLDSLAKILANKTFRLSELKLVNDPIESERVDSLYKNKIFTLCFCHEQNESIPMWKIYASNQNGVALLFENLDFLEQISNYILNDRWEVRECVLLDVLYVNNLERLKKDFDFGGNSPSQVNTCLGFAKTKVWEYEQETRVRCYVDVVRKHPSRIFQQGCSRDDIGYNYPDFNYVFCKIPDESLLNMKIIFNPFMDKEQKNIIVSVVKSYLPNFNGESFINSNLEGKIR
ncbi:DUF2971 family protein [Hydrogenoanaerobacterium saccharovorans]|uniref:DUF2971 domain-containing protein n=1 Tax=Hydrogenoanaerobacterium saccharovorans TaxID=474960 RepID=A0A1H8BMN7_9FIRM|nr:DUF2971 domain-containing protein [Hydrogenoanaerobacterium saccharovorans]RPF47330.1 DUF2971 family protein [Hydrogenoanaerobacterium saccharovorans]SEM84032.1 Protein of unknown function [Hydrogenoanaerobacterium saccharovorans]